MGMQCTGMRLRGDFHESDSRLHNLEKVKMMATFYHTGALRVHLQALLQWIAINLKEK